jgi:hypothetical protein
MNTLKATVLDDRRMIGIAIVGPDKAPFLLGEKKVVKAEIRLRSRPLGCWRSYLFWLIVVTAFFAFLYLLDLLA